MKKNFSSYISNHLRLPRGWIGRQGGGVEGEEKTERVRFKTGEEIRKAEVPSILRDMEGREKLNMLSFVIQEREPKMLFDVLIVCEYDTSE